MAHSANQRARRDTFSRVLSGRVCMCGCGCVGVCMQTCVLVGVVPEHRDSAASLASAVSDVSGWQIFASRRCFSPRLSSRLVILQRISCISIFLYSHIYTHSDNVQSTLLLSLALATTVYRAGERVFAGNYLMFVSVMCMERAH